MSIPERNNVIHLALVVQTLDSAIQRINHYPVDKYLGKRGGRKGGPKTAKPHRNAQKPANRIGFFPEYRNRAYM